MSYALQQHSARSQKGLLSLKQLQGLAQALQCNNEEEVRLIILGMLEHAPPLLGNYVEEIERENIEMRKAMGKAPSRFRLVKDNSQHGGQI